MKTIWKFPFEVNDSFRVSMPPGAKVLSVQVQRDQPCIWALVSPDAEDGRTVERGFHVFGTGHLIPGFNLSYIGTFQLYDGAFVGHLFEDSHS